MPWIGVFIIQCYWGSSTRLSVRKQTGRGEGVSSWGKNALKPGDRLQMSSGRSTQTCVYPLWKTLHVQS